MHPWYDQQVLSLDLGLERPDQCLIQLKSSIEIEWQPRAIRPFDLQPRTQDLATIHPSLCIEAAPQRHNRTRQSVRTNWKAHPFGSSWISQANPVSGAGPTLCKSKLQERFVGLQQSLRIRN